MMKRTLLSFMLAIGMVANIWADTVIEGIKYALNDDFTATVTGLDDPSFTGTVTIPETIKYYGNTYQVVQIGDKAFFEYKFKSVVIPNSVTSIGDGVFSYCRSLTSITIPNSVASIGHEAFRNCSGLTSVTIGNSVTSIGESAFSGCSGLTSVTIPNSVTSIGDGVFSYCRSLTSITIPNSVASIGYEAFSGCSGLTSVTIGNSVTSIGDWAFSGCSGLTSVTIPNSVASIGDWAFSGCTGLTSVTIGNSVTSIGDGAFSYCSSLTSITIPNSVTSIGQSAFSSCSGLTEINVDENNSTYSSIDGVVFNKSQTELVCYPGGKQGAYTIPNSVTSIGGGAFSGCSGLTSVTIPNSVTSIGSQAFYKCTGLTSVTIPNSVTSIGIQAFSGCTGLTSVIIGNSVTSIGRSAFRECSGLTSVTIGNSVTSIGSSAFYGCTGLTSVTINSNEIMSKSYSSSSNLSTIFGKQVQTYIIGDSVTSIGSYAFYGCTGLTSVTIPNSVNSISEGAFQGCTSLTDIYCHIDDPLTISSRDFGNVPKNTCTLHVPIGSGDAYRNAYGWKDFLNIVEDLPTPSSFTIGNLKYTITSGSTVRVSKDGTLTGELVIPESVEYEGKQYSVTSIGSSAFSACTGLTSVTIPNSVTSIRSSAFNNCTGLTSVTINSNEIMSKSNSSYSYLSTIFGNQVQTYTIGNSVTSIGQSAFQGCSRLTSVNIGNSVTSIGVSAFINCTGLTAINVDGNNINYSSIDGVVFNKSQTELVCYPGGKQGAYTIPNSVTSIGNHAFYKCTGLTSVTFGNSVTSIGDRAFYGCTGLTSIEIPNSVTSIGNWVFSRCTGLTSVTIPNSVTSIGSSAFAYCSGLTSVTIGNSVTSIGSSAFYGCSGLTSVTIPNSVTSIEGYVFGDCTGLTDIYCHIEEPLTINSSVFDKVQKNTCTLHVPIGSKEKYEVADVWKEFNIVEDLPTGIVSIDNSQSTIDNDVWFTLNGVRLNGKPTIPGIYIVNGLKVVIK